MPVARIAALLLSLFSFAPAHAASSQRTFVASTGVDTSAAFNCSLVAPCRSFAAAISVTSPKGEVIVLDSAAYGVIPAITKSIYVTAPPGIYAGITVFSGDGITINAGINDTVVLRGLTINGQGGANGITITNALVVHVENCVIANMSIGINQVKGLLEVKDTIVRNNSNIGVAAIVTTAADARVTVSRSLISSNNYGIYVSAAPDIIALAIAAISDSAISGNGVGVHVDGNILGPYVTGQVVLTRDTVTSNAAGLEILAAGAAVIDGNNLWGNTTFDITGDPIAEIASANNNHAQNISSSLAAIKILPNH